jgi:hypothetical protein
MTDHAKHIFEVKEFVTSDEKMAPWIMLTLLRQPDLPVLGKGFLGFDLKPGTTIKEAEALVATLNDMVEGTSYTDPHEEAERINREGEELQRRKREGRMN